MQPIPDDVIFVPNKRHYWVSMYSIPDDGFKTSCFLLSFRADDPCQFLASNVAKPDDRFLYHRWFIPIRIYSLREGIAFSRVCLRGGSHVRTCSNSFIWGPPGLSPLPFYTNHMDTWNPSWIPQTRSNFFTWEISPGSVLLSSPGTCWQAYDWPSIGKAFPLYVFTTLKISNPLTL